MFPGYEDNKLLNGCLVTHMMCCLFLLMCYGVGLVIGMFLWYLHLLEFGSFLTKGHTGNAIVKGLLK